MSNRMVMGSDGSSAERSVSGGGGGIRARILAAATRLFAARGFDGTPVQAVADEVGVSKQAILHHFETKEALHAAVLEQLVSHWNDVLPRLLLAATAGDGRFEGIMNELVAFFRADRDRARLLLREALDRPDAMRELLRHQVRPWINAIGAYVKKGQQTGEVPADADPEAYVMNVIVMTLGGLASLDCVSVVVPGAPAAQGHRYVTEMMRIARASLFAPPPPVTPAARGARRLTKR